MPTRHRQPPFSTIPQPVDYTRCAVGGEDERDEDRRGYDRLLSLGSRYNVVVTESPRDEFPQQFVGDLMASWSR
jgi:hypothetical protein